MDETTPRSGSKGCFKFGCFGCLGAVALLVGLPILIALLGLALGSPKPDYGNVDLRQPLPEATGTATPEPASPAEEIPPTLEGPPSIPSSADLGADSPRPLSLGSTPPPPAGTIELDLEMGKFTIEPAPPGEGLRVEGDYDRATFELVEKLDRADDGSWHYLVALRSKVGMFRRIWGDSDVENELRIYLPRDRPFALLGKISTGQSRTELGGLWVTDVDLGLSMGDHEIRFSEPTIEPLGRFDVQAKMGETDVFGLGNASPSLVKTESSMGEFDLDLSGPWRGDAEVQTTFSFGQCTVRVPATVRLEVEGSQMSFGEKRVVLPEQAPPEGAPTLTLAASGSFGELRVVP